MRKSLISLLAISTFTMGGLAVSAEEIDSSNSDIANAEVIEVYDELDLASAKNLKEYTETENVNDGLNTQSGFVEETITVKESLIPLKENSSQFTTFGAGEWDYITSDTINTGASKIVSSNGGDFLFIVDQPSVGPGFTWMYKIMEDDGAVGDDTVGTVTLNNTGTPQEIIVNARNYVDGDNKKAEFYIIKMTVPTRSVDVDFYD
ncbi:hypothetical protein ACFRCQ_24065 [Cytobacillus firmus]|uniref:Uncharacterized protein n=1 Tax=Cytobacillus oceanisediminis TaxID=665099 RepID=A0ABX3CKM6_9BACI|nr:MULTISPECIES: hypothetical protein [Bacillaceae]MBN8202593.1 hypothetical protein [Bacillus sp. NTK034]OHX41414.1 hypothetical protein BBV17_28895 [Cytobacillus oceanisediminis]